VNVKFSHEPVAWLGAVIAVALLVKNVLQHEPISDTVLEPVVVAVSALIVRQKVIPVAKDK
jgi:hypothetical protein